MGKVPHNILAVLDNLIKESINKEREEKAPKPFSLLTPENQRLHGARQSLVIRGGDIYEEVLREIFRSIPQRFEVIEARSKRTGKILKQGFVGHYSDRILSLANEVSTGNRKFDNFLFQQEIINIKNGNVTGNHHTKKFHPDTLVYDKQNNHLHVMEDKLSDNHDGGKMGEIIEGHILKWVALQCFHTFKPNKNDVVVENFSQYKGKPIKIWWHYANSASNIFSRIDKKYVLSNGDLYKKFNITTFLGFTYNDLVREWKRRQM